MQRDYLLLNMIYKNILLLIISKLSSSITIILQSSIILRRNRSNLWKMKNECGCLINMMCWSIVSIGNSLPVILEQLWFLCFCQISLLTVVCGIVQGNILLIVLVQGGKEKFNWASCFISCKKTTSLDTIKLPDIQWKPLKVLPSIWFKGMDFYKI